MREAWNKLIKRAAVLRRRLHQWPETAWEEQETAAHIRELLTESGIGWRACAGTGTMAMLAPHAAGRHIALRGDIDGLEMREESPLPWASQRPGFMHACGHDGHTAVLLATAWWLKLHEDALPGPVSLLFQPAEEGGHGAREMIADGALEGVDAVYGWHNWPAIAFGKAVCPDGPVMCANGTFHITLRGRGGHASQPELCRDPVTAAAAVTLALQQIVSRRLPAREPAVVSVTSVEASSLPTVIPDTAKLQGSIRAGSVETRAAMFRMIREIAEGTASAWGVTAEVVLHDRYDATVNHAEEAARVRSALERELGAGWRDERLPVPIMASEDFSYFLNRIPGAYALIGAGDEDGHDVPCHSGRYDFNDRLIPLVVRLFARLAGAPVPDPETEEKEPGLLEAG